MCDPIKWRQKTGEPSAETAENSAGAESHSIYSSRPSETPVSLQPPDMAASPEKLQGPEPTEVQSFPTVPAQEVQTKQTTETHVAIPSKAQPLCTTLNKSQPVENNITRAGRLSKPPGYLKDYAWLHLLIVGDSKKVVIFFSFFFLLRLWTLLKQLTLFVPKRSASVLWLMLLGFH